MLIVLFIVIFILFIVSLIIDNFKIITSVLLSICLFAIITTFIDVSHLRVIDDKIAMYQEENTRIETQIATIVDGYKEYETDTFTGLTSESTMMLATIYPELKSNELVQSQIDIYANNNERIKGLREEKINGSVKRWWLYFGK